MATATLKRTRAGNVSKSALNQAGSLLQDLPEKPRDLFSLRDAVAQLQDVIKDALSKGYSYEDIAVLLAEQTIVISPATLKRYVLTNSSRAAQKSSPAKTRAKRTAKVPSSEVAQSELEPEAIAPTETAQATRGRRKSAPAAQSEAVAEKPEVKSSRRGRTPKTTASSQRSSATRGRKTNKA
ncbi:MAG: hypothetical protein HY785_06640 [Oscillatoriophycideae cyanobacterium NC_groundwater_1537_Pr4_S-0.65um_50_18]|nr:hypothetical protein [Oscillatoriophycideae cyanobacterium NC_groundwater_1537_Pr4_S-0.65um_50_18]